MNPLFLLPLLVFTLLAAWGYFPAIRGNARVLSVAAAAVLGLAVVLSSSPAHATPVRLRPSRPRASRALQCTTSGFGVALSGTAVMVASLTATPETGTASLWVGTAATTIAAGGWLDSCWGFWHRPSACHRHPGRASCWWLRDRATADRYLMERYVG